MIAPRDNVPSISCKLEVARIKPETYFVKVIPFSALQKRLPYEIGASSPAQKLLPVDFEHDNSTIETEKHITMLLHLIDKQFST